MVWLIKNEDYNRARNLNRPIESTYLNLDTMEDNECIVDVVKTPVNSTQIKELAGRLDFKNLLKLMKWHRDGTRIKLSYSISMSVGKRINGMVDSITVRVGVSCALISLLV